MADGSVVLESGGMAVLTTSVSSHVMTKGSAGFLPLNVRAVSQYKSSSICNLNRSDP